MKIPIKKTTCAALTGALLLSMTGCSELPFAKGNSEEEIVDAAQAFVEAAADCDFDEMGKISVEDFEEDSEDWEAALDFEEGDIYDADAAKFAEAVADTIEYEIDEDSAEVKDKKASVDVVFTLADYEAVLNSGEYTDIDEMIDALEDADIEEIEVTVEFEKEDDEWLVSNYDEIMEDLYEFTETDALNMETYGFDYDPSTQDGIAANTYYNLENSLYPMYLNTNNTMYQAFTGMDDMDYVDWVDTTSSNLVEGIYDSGVDEIRFIQHSTEDLGEIGICVTYSPVSNANLDDTEVLTTEYIQPSYDTDGNVYYEVVIEAPADGYYLIEIAPSVADLYAPVLTVACRVGDAN